MIFWGIGASVVAVVVLGVVKLWKALEPCGELFDDEEWDPYDPYSRVEVE